MRGSQFLDIYDSYVYNQLKLPTCMCQRLFASLRSKGQLRHTHSTSDQHDLCETAAIRKSDQHDLGETAAKECYV